MTDPEPAAPGSARAPWRALFSPSRPAPWMLVAPLLWAVACNTTGGDGRGGDERGGDVADAGGDPSNVWLDPGTPCDPAAAQCGPSGACVAIGDTGPTCHRTCETAAACEATEACFARDDIGGASGGARVCAPALGPGSACDPGEAYCSGSLVCADHLDGAGPVCAAACDPTVPWTWRACDGELCVSLAELGAEGGELIGACLHGHRDDAACDPVAPLCDLDWPCLGNSTLGYACREHLTYGYCVEAFGSCNTDADCSEGSCSSSCASRVITRGFEYDPAAYCVDEVACVPGLDVATCGADRTCVAFAGWTVELGRPYRDEPPGHVFNTCMEAGTVGEGGACDAFARCAPGLACVGDGYGHASQCRAACDPSGGAWPADCGATSGATCDATSCCVDLSCFDARAPAGQAGVRMPPHDGCNVAMQTGCGPGAVCAPQNGAWARGVCVASEGGGVAGEACGYWGVSEAGCGAGLACILDYNYERACYAWCDPAAGSGGCEPLPDGRPTVCLDAAELYVAAPPGVAGLCMPFCHDDVECGAGWACLYEGADRPGVCAAKCDARTASCDFGQACVPIGDEATGLGPGVCDTRMFGGLDLCDTDADCPSDICVPTADLPTVGFCAVFAPGSTTCDPAAQTGCPPGLRCGEDGAGRRFCVAKACYVFDPTSPYCSIEEGAGVLPLSLGRCSPVTEGGITPGICVPSCKPGASGSWQACAGIPEACQDGGVAVLDGACAPERVWCDIFTNEGCPPRDICYASPITAPGGMFARCYSTGGPASLMRGEECTGDWPTCDVNTFCATDSQGDGICVNWCLPAVGGCGEGYACVDVSNEYFADFGHIGICRPDDGCDPIAQDCGPGETCRLGGEGVLQNSRGETHECRRLPANAIIADVGEACRVDPVSLDWPVTRCAAGLFCPYYLRGPNGQWLPLECTRLCDPRTTRGNSACPKGEGGFGPDQVCFDVSDQTSDEPGTLGVCLK